MHFDKIFHNAKIKFPSKVFLEPRCLSVKKAIDAFKNKDEQFAHLNTDDVEKVAKLIEEKKTWFNFSAWAGKVI
mgnify:CR=1 FL=1